MPPPASSPPPEKRRASYGLRPLARLVSWAVAGVPPKTMGIGPVPSSAKALERAGLTISDMDLIELNEAFASQVLAVTREWELDWPTSTGWNLNGSGISPGARPVGATGGRILATAAARDAPARGRGTAWRPCASAAARVLCRSLRADRLDTAAQKRYWIR